MKKIEYLWWVETIRQNEFRELLPINICLFVVAIICLITLTFSVISSSSQEIRAAFFEVGLISLALVLIFTVYLVSSHRKAYRQIEAIKKLRDLDKNDIDTIDDELLYFFDINKK